jgi:hypothetical protein
MMAAEAPARLSTVRRESLLVASCCGDLADLCSLLVVMIALSAVADLPVSGTLKVEPFDL